MSDWLDTGPEPVSADSIAAKIGRDARDAVDAKLRQWQDSEVGVFALEDVLDAARHRTP